MQSQHESVFDPWVTLCLLASWMLWVLVIWATID
jgi:hypothetical protein